MATTEGFALGRRVEDDAPYDVLATDVDGRLVVPVPEVTRTAPADTLSLAVGEREEVPTRRRGTPPEWLPVALAIVGWPLWWALGLTQLVFILAAVPLAWALKKKGNVRYPPGFGLWILFLILVLFSGFALDVDAAGTSSSEGIGRYIAFGFRFANYLALSIFLLYIGNASEKLLPRSRVIGWLATLGAASLGLALLALVLPNLQFTSPLAGLLPDFLSDGSATRLAQVQPVLGDPTPRPAAPFKFTNAWGNNTSLLIIWLVVAWGVLGSRRRRFMLATLMVLAAVPIVYSLNRGMWLGLGLALAIVATRLALRGRTMVLVATSAVLILASVVFLLSPLKTLVTERLAAGHSNSVRSSLAETSLGTALQSPILGFGSTRDTQGSEASIAIGPTVECPRCGGRDIGSTGQFTLLLIAQGFMGLALYIAFLGRSLFAYLRDHSPLGIAGTTVVAMELFYGMFYSALTMPLAITFCSIALLWRNDQLRRKAEQEDAAAAAQGDDQFWQRA
jgi:hypothetical protein